MGTNIIINITIALTEPPAILFIVYCLYKIIGYLPDGKWGYIIGKIVDFLFGKLFDAIFSRITKKLKQSKKKSNKKKKKKKKK